MIAELPRIGLGTSKLGVKLGSGDDDPEQCVETVLNALELGYRHIDTAQMYGNEHLVGRAIEQSTVERDEIFLSTKVHPGKLAHDDVIASTEESLDKLRTDHVDLLYVHWPLDTYDPVKTLPAFDWLRKRGLIHHVGASNFTIDLLDEAREILDAPIAANQMQIHPLLPPTEGERAELLPYCRAADIELIAWSPLVRGKALKVPEIQSVANKHDVSPARVILSWLLDYDLKVVVKSTGRSHLRDNLAARRLELDDDDLQRIDSIDKRIRLFDKPAAPWNL